MKKQIALLLILWVLLIPFSSLAGDLNIRGIVLSKSDGSPLVGATVVIKGTTNGVVVDAKGNFTLSASSGEIIIVSYLGFESQSITLKDESPLRVELSELQGQLNEIVITALGINKEKKSLGYAVQKVRPEAISAVPETNLINSLAGKIAGVNVTNSQGSMGSSRIVIRGETSISGNNQPLFVVDGVPVDNSQLTTSDASRDFANAISDINSENIESISVLKGPNAAALYGSRAASGVILIKTKTGRG